MMDEDEKLLLMRLVDGELADDEVALAAARCVASPQAAAFVAAATADRALLRAAFPPEHGDTSDAMTVIERSLAARRRPANHNAWRAALPIAASVLLALVVGAGGVLLVDRRAEDTASRVVAALTRDRELTAAAFVEALDKQVSGQSVAWRNPDTGSNGTITPVRTFRAADGRWCRQYEERLDVAGSSEQRSGIACRDGDGWRPEVERPGAA